MAIARRTLLAALAGLAVIPVSVAAAGAPADHLVDRFSFLHVGTTTGAGDLRQVLDDQGRSVLLRGVNVNGLEDYYSNSPSPTSVGYPIDPAAYEGGRCPERIATIESMAVCDFDAQQIRGFGYDVVRLAVSWSLLEPQPGRIDPTYVERIAQVVGWLRAAGVYSVIDMHQDAWSKYLYTRPGGPPCPPPFSPVGGVHEADGAPEWASTHSTPVCQAGAREVDPAVQEDFQRLWSDAAGPDGVGLQEHFAGAVLALARRFHDDPAVAGYDILNEPSPGYTPPPAMDATEVYPFYAKVIQTVRTAIPGFRQLFFVEPDVTRDVTDQRYGLGPWSTYSSYPNVVYAPHIYTHVFTPDALAGAPAGAPLYPVSSGYASAAADARDLGLALWDGEFGVGVASDETTLREHYESQDGLGVGGVLWVWKADGDVKTGAFSAMQGPFGRGTPFPSRVKFTDRAYPIATAGTLRSLRYDPDHAIFELTATSPPVGDRAQATLLYVPAASTAPISATGARLEVVPLAGGAREAYVFPNGGDYRVYSGSVVTAAPPAPAPTKTKACASRRRIVVHLRSSRSHRVLYARAYVNGRARRLHARARVLVVDLRGLPRGTVNVRIAATVRTEGGRRHVVSVRRFRTCAPRRVRG